MLPPFIIDQIRRREEDERRRRGREQPRVELPVDAFPPTSEKPEPGEEDQPNRGVIIIDLG